MHTVVAVTTRACFHTSVMISLAFSPPLSHTLHTMVVVLNQKGPPLLSDTSNIGSPPGTFRVKRTLGLKTGPPVRRTTTFLFRTTTGSVFTNTVFYDVSVFPNFVLRTFWLRRTNRRPARDTGSYVCFRKFGVGCAGKPIHRFSQMIREIPLSV